MLEDIESARGELQRAEHLIYVTLKYTRTGDVMKSIVERLIDSMNYSITDMLEFTKHKNKIKEFPASDMAKFELLKVILKKIILKDKNLKKYLDLYLLLKKVSKTPVTSVREEYRKNLTLIADDIEIDMSTIVEYYNDVKEFFIFSRTWIKENN
ncbi:hypothetical protein J4409_02925 [Candidatus Woesearchaeota archaeon]|nr:hypothetical protein [Candidatus Woesearchaeota archaeon]